MPQGFRAIVVSKKDNKFDIDIKDRTIDELPDGDLLIRVEFSDRVRTSPKNNFGADQKPRACAFQNRFCTKIIGRARTGFKKYAE